MNRGEKISSVFGRQLVRDMVVVILIGLTILDLAAIFSRCDLRAVISQEMTINRVDRPILAAEDFHLSAVPRSIVSHVGHGCILDAAEPRGRQTNWNREFGLADIERALKSQATALLFAVQELLMAKHLPLKTHLQHYEVNYFSAVAFNRSIRSVVLLV